MSQNDWVAKLTSRKFWMALTGLISGILLALKYDEQTVTQITGIIMAGASVLAYILGEAWTDAAGAKTDAHIADDGTHPPEDHMEDDGR